MIIFKATSKDKTTTVGFHLNCRCEALMRQTKNGCSSCISFFGVTHSYKELLRTWPHVESGCVSAS